MVDLSIDMKSRAEQNSRGEDFLEVEGRTFVYMRPSSLCHQDRSKQSSPSACSAPFSRYEAILRGHRLHPQDVHRANYIASQQARGLGDMELLSQSAGMKLHRSYPHTHTNRTGGWLDSFGSPILTNLLARLGPPSGVAEKNPLARAVH